jgi:hypothetical protein
MSMEVYQMWSYEEKAERVARLFALEQAMADPGVRQPIFIVLNGETDLAFVRKEMAKFCFANVVLGEESCGQNYYDKPKIWVISKGFHLTCRILSSTIPVDWAEERLTWK